jgi:hypothetical protein
MTRPKGSKGKSEKRVGAQSGGAARTRSPGVSAEMVRQWFVRWGIIGELPEGRRLEDEPTPIVLKGPR